MRNAAPLARVAAALLVAGVLVAVGPATPALAASCGGHDISDFNGDGVSDVAVYEPGDQRFHVIYGHDHKLNATTPQDQLISLPGPDANDTATMVTGDFNGDGCTDLAISYTIDDNPNPGKGRVAVFFGSTAGLKTPGTILTSGTTREGDLFGYSLAAGDVNGDGKYDLIVGAPDTNSIYVFLGTGTGIKTTSTEYVEGHGGVPGSTGGFNSFGQAVAAGDFNGDGHVDVAIGAPGEDNASGRVIVLNGGTTTSPLSTTKSQIWSQNSAGVPGSAEAGDQFGSSLAVGDFKGNFAEDLAIGVPDEGLTGGPGDAGLVNVLFSAGTSGLTGTGAQAWSQASAGVPGSPEINGQWGSTLAAGDFNGSISDDLAIGEPSATVGTGDNDAGSVTVLYGESSGLGTDGAQLFTQATSGISGTPESNDNFGASLAVVRVTNNNLYDLVIGVPGEGLGSIFDAGVMQFIPGSTHGLTATGSELWSDGSAGIKGSTCSCGFGIAVS